jgi:hypothetical protein
MRHIAPKEIFYMKTICLLLCILLAACAAGRLQNGAATSGTGDEPAVSRLQYPYQSSDQCKGCHADQYQQYEDSMHAKAFTNPLFNSQYFNEIVPRAQRDPALVQEARGCISCHAPTVFMNYTGLVSTPAQAGRFETGVTCDFCHTLGGYGDNGDYQQVLSGKKQGPFLEEGAISHHSEYSGYMQLGEYCGRCHNATNHIGLSVKSTYDEWRESIYGMSGSASIITCQECHMSKDGYLRNGSAEFERGQAAHMNIGSAEKKQKEHDKLYNHSFPGAHSVSQQLDALSIDFRVGSRSLDASGLLPFSVLINNERTGHKMPSGSSDLRFMWLVVTATGDDGTKISFWHRPKTATGIDYSLAGSSPDDAAILGKDVPTGSRLYRNVLVNADGRQSLYQSDAVKSVFDNRLAAKELRKETYYLKPPTKFSGKVTLTANLYYKGAPSSFTKRMQVPDFTPVLVASHTKHISVEAAHAPK